MNRMVPYRVAALSLCLASPVFADVRGLYGSDCLPMNDLSATKDLLFHPSEQRMEIVQTVYMDDACSLPAYDFSFSGPYEYDEENGHLDYSFSSIQLRVLDERIALAFIEHEVCGFGDWSLDVAHEVTGATCAGTRMPKAGLKLYDLMQESENGLQLGLASDSRDALEEDQRPDALDPHMFSAR